jgi:hypothetical protein
MLLFDPPQSTLEDGLSRTGTGSKLTSSDFMKASIVLTLLILALGLPLGLRYRQQLAGARERHAQLIAAASKSGMIYDPTRRSHAGRGTRHEREDKQEVARKLAAELIACGEKSGTPTAAEQGDAGGTFRECGFAEHGTIENPLCRDPCQQAAHWPRPAETSLRPRRGGQ